MQVDAALARRKIVDWLWDYLGEQQGFQERVSEAGWNAYREELKFRNSSSKAPARRVSELEQQAANLAKAIAGGGRFEAIFKEAEQVEEELQKTRKELRLQNKQSENTNVCKNREEFAKRFPAAILDLSHRSFEFAELFRRIMPQFQIQPVQAYDRPMVRPRSKFFLAIGGVEEESFKMEQPISLDLFDPPSHIVAMESCLKTKQENPKWSMDRIGQHLDIPTMTVKRAFDYFRRMKASETSDPYRELDQRPENASRWK